MHYFQAIASTEDKPFAAPKQQPVGKVSVNLPTDNWLCTKMEGLNLTLAQGYPSRGSETPGLQRTSLSSTVNLMLSGTGSTSAKTDRSDLFHSGIVTQPS